MNQFQMFYNSHNKLAKQNEHFIELIKDKVNPLTNKDLKQLIKNFPERWKRFSGYVGKLKN